MSDSTDIIIDLIARAIYDANDVKIFGLEDLTTPNNPTGLNWYRTEAVQVLEALREAGVDLIALYDGVVNPPQPPVSLVPRRLPKVIVRASGEVTTDNGGTE